MTGLTEVALFAGVGGMMLGLEAAGWSTLAAAEIEPTCQRVLRARFPRARVVGDVTRVDGRALDVGTPTLLTYTFPCQDLSVAGKRAGLAGSRSGLFYEALRIREELGCPLSLAENVPGLLSSDGGADFARCLSALIGTPVVVPSDGWRNAGVAVGDRGITAWATLDLQHFGPPQRRRRVFLLTAHALGDSGTVLLDPAEVLAIESCLRGDSETGGTTREGAAAAARSGARGQSEGGVTVPLLEVGKRTGTSTDDPRAGIGIGDEGDPMYTLQAGAQHGVMEFLPQSDRVYLEGGIAPTLAATDGGRRQSPSVLAFDTTQITSDKNYSRPRAGDPCHPLAAGAHAPAVVTVPDVASTLGGGSSPRGFCDDLDRSGAFPVMHGVPRRLTPLECVRLMGWPDDHLDVHLVDGGKPLSDAVRYRMCGNGVGAPVAEWLGWRIRHALEAA